MKEQTFESILAKYPELVEDGLTLAGRQVRVGKVFMDLLFKDRRNQKLIVEIKVGPILREHIAQLMDYEGHLLSADDPTVRVMLIGNRVPDNLRRTLDHHGMEWREFPVGRLISYLEQRGDRELLDGFSSEEVPVRTAHGQSQASSTAEPISPGKGLVVAALASGPQVSIADKVWNSFKSHQGKVFSRKEAVDMVLAAYPGTNRTSVLPSDYCYNIVNRGIPFRTHFFEYIDGGSYKVLGPGYPYVGPITWRGEVVGEWKAGHPEPTFFKKVHK